MAELINREPIVKRVKNFAEYDWNDTRKRAYMEFLDMLTDAPTVTEAEIRTKAIDEVMAKAREIQEKQIKGLEHYPMRGGKQWAVYMNTYLGHIQTACRRLLAEQLKEE